MGLPALRLSLLRAWPSAPDISAGLRRALDGTTLVLPGALGEAEREEIVDLLALFLDLPARVVPGPDHAREGELTVVALALDGDPPKGPQKGVVVCEKRRGPGERRLELTQHLILLRDAIAESVGRRHSGTRLQSVAAWISEVADTPSTAVRFASGALVKHLDDPMADDAGLYLAGLAAVIGWLLRGVDGRVTEWVMALATGAPYPGRLVSADAILLGEDAARQRAFEAGLVLLLPEERGDSLELRRPLEIIRHLGDLSVSVTLAEVAKALAPALEPAVGLVFDRLLRPGQKRLGLEGPSPVHDFRGRDEVIDRLVALFEPAHEIRTTVLYGVAGVGKRQVAAALGERLAGRFEPVWVRLSEGPEVGWMRVAHALGIETQHAEALARDRAGIPRWVRTVHDALRFRPCLLVVEGADTLLEDEVPPWLPSGPGTSCVLVLSSRAERALERAHDAVAVRLEGVAKEPARLLLAEKAPRFEEAIRRGEADKLIENVGGHPGALSLAASLLEHRSLAEVTEAVRRGEQAIPEVLREVIGALPEEEGKLVRALAVCAPAGSPPDLALAVADLVDAKSALDRLIDRAMVLQGPRIVRLAGVVRIEAERRLDQEAERRRDLETRHARATDTLFMQARGQDISTREDLDADLRLAVQRLTAWCKAGARGSAKWLADLATELLGQDGETRLENARLAVDAYSATLAFAPEHAVLQGNLASGHVKIGDALIASGDTAGALASYQAAYASVEWLSARDPSNHGWQHQLGAVRCRIGDVFWLQGNRPAALEMFRAALADLERLASQDSSKGEWQHDIAGVSYLISDALLKQGDTEGALRASQTGISRMRRILEKDPTNADWQCTLALNHIAHGDVMLAQRNETGALESFRAADNIMTSVVQEAPLKARLLRELGTSRNRLGKILLALGDSAGALAAYRAAFDAMESIVRQDTGSLPEQRDLGMNQARIGDVLLAQADAAGARAAYQAALATIDRLVRLAPGNAQWQADLAELSCKLSRTLDPADRAEARALLERARRILTDLASQSRLTHEQQQWLPQIEAALKSLPAESTRPPAS